MDSTSLYSLELSVLERTGGKALATDHRGLSSLNKGDLSVPVDA